MLSGRIRVLRDEKESLEAKLNEFTQHNGDVEEQLKHLRVRYFLKSFIQEKAKGWFFPGFVRVRKSRFPASEPRPGQVSGFWDLRETHSFQANFFNFELKNTKL